MIHRDLKPENIVLCGHQPVEIPKVLDFGLAKALEASGGGLHTRPGLVAGTPHYMAPEHLRGGEPSPDWDLWALSVIAFEMVTGVLPRSGGLGAASTGILPTDCRKFFERALSDNPIDRPTSVEEFYNVLERVLPCDVPDSRDERRASGVKRALGRPD
jgi:serine/threonine-protein kinase